MSKQLKRLMTREFASHYREVAHCVVVDYSGLTAVEADDLRGALREKGARLEVLRNRLATRAFEEVGLQEVNALIEGPSAIAHGEDIAALCRSVAEWAREHQKLTIRGGTLDRRRISAEEVARLARIPSIDILRAQMAGLVLSPVSGIASVIRSLHRKIAIALEAIRGKKQEDPSQGG